MLKFLGFESERGLSSSGRCRVKSVMFPQEAFLTEAFARGREK